MKEAQPAHVLLPIAMLKIPIIITSVWSSEKNQNISVKSPATEQTRRIVTDVYWKATIEEFGATGDILRHHDRTILRKGSWVDLKYKEQREWLLGSFPFNHHFERAGLSNRMTVQHACFVSRVVLPVKTW
jgi:hypothetical protein